MNEGRYMHAPAPVQSGNHTMAPPRRRMMMHMTFYWGKNALILFDRWPGYDNLGMYLLSLAVVFFLSVAVEWFSHCTVLREKTSSSAAATQRSVVVGLLQTVMYTVRVGLSYLVMLAVMSFNGGVFLAAVAGYGVGFFFFGSRAFNKPPVAQGKTSDLPPLNCC